MSGLLGYACCFMPPELHMWVLMFQAATYLGTYIRKCDVCGVRDARVMQRHTGRALCEKCFKENIVSRFSAEVSKYRMFGSGDRILLALSGGKDSYVLLDVVKEVHDVSKIGIVTIIEGIEGYNRFEDIDWIVATAREYGIDLYVTSFKEYTAYSLDELVKLGKLKGFDISPCTYCGVLRRRIINYYARSQGYDKVLTAHNLDDEVQTYIMNILRGDSGRLIQNHPLSRTLSRYFVKRVKPLRKIYEWETSVYAYMRGFRFQELECPYIRYQPTLRAEIRDYLYEVEQERPGSLLRVIEAIDIYIERELLSRPLGFEELPTCSACGAPTAQGRKICVLCEVLDKLGISSRVPF